VLHVHPQDTPLQVRVELAGPVAHGVQLVPQAEMSVSALQTLPQRW
jgi:hypothetical protein